MAGVSKFGTRGGLASGDGRRRPERDDTLAALARTFSEAEIIEVRRHLRESN
jgi:hypothetical protein